MAYHSLTYDHFFSTDGDQTTQWTSPPNVSSITLLLNLRAPMSVYDVLIYFDTNTGPATKLTITYMNDYLNKTSIVMQMLAQDCTTVCM